MNFTGERVLLQGQESEIEEQTPGRPLPGAWVTSFPFPLHWPKTVLQCKIVAFRTREVS